MKKFLLVLALMVVPTLAFAQAYVPDHGPNTSDTAAPAVAEALLTVTIPTLVGVEVHNDLSFDLAPYFASPQIRDFEGVISNQTNPAPVQAGVIGLSFLSTVTDAQIGATLGTWLAGDPGFATTLFQQNANNGQTDLNVWSSGNVGSTGAQPGAAFSWTREDMDVNLSLPVGLSLVAGTYEAVIDVTITNP